MKNIKRNLSSRTLGFMLIGSLMMFAVPSFAQNHNPEFEISDVHLGGSDYVFIPPDAEATPFRTAVPLQYRDDNIPENGSTTLSWESGDKINVYQTGVTSALDLTQSPTWSDADQGDKSLELEAHLDAGEGDSQTLQAIYTNPDGGDSPVGEREFTLVKLDLDVDANYDGTIDDDDEADEASAGGLVFLNDDDDDQDGTPDKDQDGAVAGEDDLIEIKLSLDPDLGEGEVRLEVVSGSDNIKVWDDSTKTTEIDLSETWDLSSDTLPSSLFVEAIAESSSPRDVELILTYQPDDTLEITDSIVLTLLKVDIDIHQPNLPFVGLARPDPIEIPENEQQNPNRCQILINDDNDDLDSLFNGSAIADPYPQDNDDDILKIRDPIGFGHPTDDDDVVLVTLRQFNGVNTGKIKLTTSSNADVRFFKYEEGEYELDAVSFSDLEVDLSNPGTESPLKDLPNEDVSFYVEGINANDDLAVQMIFEDTNGNELARQEVHLKIIGTKPLSLSAQGHGGLGESMAQSNLTEMIQGANIVRRDRDGLDADADVSVPITFKLGQWKGMDNDPAHADWYTTTSSQYGESKDILDYMESVPGGLNIYLLYDVTNAGGFARRGAEVMVIPIQGSPHDVVAHEWLHAFGNIGHICTTDHLMVGDGCDSSIQRGSDVTESEKTLFLAED